ncbi:MULTISPECIES: CBM35 domain-containing protein [unclassified Streptomyces]|uniref:CBM35 domain-containing protein n=1 Tax=unclassified Streptomyces TaxID=2593676 RepID=UPI002E0DA842|nr:MULTISPECIES: CBM35 domain-containing protein [unclassified Streptomyces]WSR26636.1 carbohydrate-binding protein [Streptomyces sp. NBC_01205]
MTTPANHGPNSGANQPEDDDPFGYLYADGQAAGATPPTQGGGYGYPGPTVGGQPGVQPGVPRTSYNQVRTVGERTYGGQRGQVPAQPQSPAYQAQYQAPEALQAGGYGVPPQQGQTTTTIPAPGGHGGSSGSSRKGMLIAAVAVVAAVVIGIGAALAFGGGDKDKDKGKDGTASGQQSAQPQNPQSAQPSASASADVELPKADASGAGMSLTGGAHLEGTVPGAKSAGGQYVGGLNAAGAAATWTVDVAKAGQYKLKMVYGVPGKDASTTLTINGEAQSRPINMKNFSQAKPGEWDKGWTNTWSLVTLKQGTNTIKISCEAGNQCEVALDQLWLEKG